MFTRSSQQKIITIFPSEFSSDEWNDLNLSGLKSAGVTAIILQAGDLQRFSELSNLCNSLEKKKNISENQALSVIAAIHDYQDFELYAESEIDGFYLSNDLCNEEKKATVLFSAMPNRNILLMPESPTVDFLVKWQEMSESAAAGKLRKLICVSTKPTDWEYLLEIKRKFPELPVIFKTRPEVMPEEATNQMYKAAFDLGYDGCVLEVADVAQATISAGYLAVYQTVAQEEQTKASDLDFLVKLETLRTQIDRIDADIIALLSERMKISREIGAGKSAQHVTAFQKDRWAQLFNDRQQSMKACGLSENFSETFLRTLHRESIRQQLEEMKNIQLHSNEENSTAL